MFDLTIQVSINKLVDALCYELQDFTVFGGSLSGAHAKKICKVKLLEWYNDM